MAENALTRGLYQAKIGPTPRNALLGGIADALRYVDEGANVPDPTNPAQKGRKVLSFISNALGIGDLAAVADRASYGLPQTQGTGFARQMLPETRNALAGAFPAAIAKPQTAARMAMSVLTNGLDGGAQRAMFIGPAARTWDAAAAAKAEELAARGVDPRAIWKQTGTFKGADGKWRQELDDSGSVLIENAKAREFMSGPGPAEYPIGPVGTMLNHPSLSAAYPDAMAIRARLRKGESASYMPNTGFGEGLDLPSIGTKSGTLHELQHAVQQREGFARGGSPEQFIESSGSLYGTKLKPEAQAIFDGAVIPGYPMSSVERDFRQSAAIQEAYRRLAGEAEARATQARMKMNALQRREVYPFDSYDVPADQLIVR